MTVNIEKPALNLREELSMLRAKVAAGVAQEAFWFSGIGAQTAFPLLRGWKPKFVYVDGALKQKIIPKSGQRFSDQMIDN